MRAGHHETTGVVTTAVLVVLVALVGLGGAIRLAQNAAELGPQVGDILTFAPGQRMPYDTPPQVKAERDSLPQCVLDTALMHRLGGSVIIESRSALPDRIYTVHWAGRHTSDGAADCGESAELTLTQEKLDMLALAVGGYGVSHQQLASNTSEHPDGSPHATR